MRACLVLALAVAAASAAMAADPMFGPPSPGGPGRLDDAALEQRFADVVSQVRAKGLGPDEVVAPAKLQDQMDQLDEAIARAQNPTGLGAAKVRLLRGQLFELEGRRDEAAKAYRGVLDDGLSGDPATTVYGMLAADLEAMGSADELTALADAAAKAKQPDDLVDHIRRQSVFAAIQPGKPFPAFALTDLGGAARKLADYRGKVLLLDCWATWCPPCVAEMPDIKAVYEANHARGFEILGVSLDDDLARLRSFVADQRIAWPQCCDGGKWSSAMATRLGLSQIPMSFLIGPDGMLIAKGLHGDELARAVDKALPAK